MTLLMDSLAEPVEIERLLRPMVDELQRAPLNTRGFADYMWQCADGHLLQIERKQWGEIQDVDAVEEQLRRELAAPVGETILLIEGVAVPTATGLDVYTLSKDARFFRLSRSYPGEGRRSQPGLYSKIMGWIYQLDKVGVGTVFTHSWEASAVAIGAWYKNSQKTEHATLQRYIRPRVNLVVHDPQVKSLMGLEGAGLGEERAKALIKRFGNLLNVLTAEHGQIASLPGFGHVLENKIFKAVGREW